MCTSSVAFSPFSRLLLAVSFPGPKTHSQINTLLLKEGFQTEKIKAKTRMQSASPLPHHHHIYCTSFSPSVFSYSILSFPHSLSTPPPLPPNPLAPPGQLPPWPPQGDRMFSAVISKQSWRPADGLAPQQPGHTDNARPSVMWLAFTEVS